MASVSKVALAPAAKRWQTQNLFFTLVFVVLAFIVLGPLFLLLISSFQFAQTENVTMFNLEAWRIALSEPKMRATISNTIALTVTRQLIAFPFAVVLAWLLARTDLPGRGWLEFLFWVSFLLPSLVVTQGWILMLDPEYGLLNRLFVWIFSLHKGPFNIYSWWGIIWAHLMANTLSVKVMLLTPAFRNMDSSLEEVSQVCGANKLRTLLRVIVPVMAPVILVVVLLATIRGLEAFEIELVLGAPRRIDVYSTTIYRFVTQEPPLFAPAAALSVIILTVMLPFIYLQRHIGSSRQYATVTGQYKNQLLRLRKWRWLAFTVVFFIVSLLTIVPMIFLVMGTFMRLYGFFSLPNPWTIRQWQAVLGDPIFLKSLSSTFTLASGAALLGMALYPIVAYIIIRTRFWGRAVLDFVSWLPYALPGIIFGLGLLWFFLAVPVLRPLYGTTFLLVIASVIGSMTLGIQIVKSNMIQLGFDLEEASWITGGSRWQTFCRVLIPILWPVLLLVGVMSFISAARNVSHVALLATGSNRPLALLQLDYMVEGRYEAASVVGMIVVVMTIGVAILARLAGARIGIKS